MISISKEEMWTDWDYFQMEMDYHNRHYTKTNITMITELDIRNPDSIRRDIKVAIAKFKESNKEEDRLKVDELEDELYVLLQKIKQDNET